MNRRHFLKSSASIGALAIFPGFWHGSPGLPPVTYFGDPNVITSVAPTFTGISDVTWTNRGTGGGATKGSFTFHAADVNTGTDTITLTNTPFVTGDNIVFVAGANGATLPTTNSAGGPLSSVTAYTYVIKTGANTIKLAFEWLNANASVALDILTAGTDGAGGEGNIVKDMNLIEYDNVPIQGGSGTGATCVAVYSAYDDQLMDIKIKDPGVGYVVGDHCTINSTDIGGLGGVAFDVAQIGFRMSRTSGTIPAFVQCTANGVRIGANGSAYEPLWFRWNFGDVQLGGTELFTLDYAYPPTGSATVDANTDQFGPMAVYPYRHANGGIPYTITLTAYYFDGSAVRSASVTKQFTANNFTAADNSTGSGTQHGEYWVDSVGGSNSNNGKSIGAPKQTLSFLQTIFNSPFQNVAVHLKNGSNFVLTTEIFINNVTSSGLRIDNATSITDVTPWGAGANPIITAGFQACLDLSMGVNSSDIAFSNITCVNNQDNGSRAINLNPAQGAVNLTDCYLYRVNADMSGGITNPEMVGLKGTQRLGAWGGTWTGEVTTLRSSGGTTSRCACTSYYDWFLVGNDCSGWGGTIASGLASGSHLFYAQPGGIFTVGFTSAQFQLWRWNKGHNADGNDNAWKLRTQTGYANVLYDCNHAQSTWNAISCGQDDLSGPLGGFNQVYQFNFAHNLVNAQGGNAVGFGTARSTTATCRDNRSFGVAIGIQPEVQDFDLQKYLVFRFYRNKMADNNQGIWWDPTTTKGTWDQASELTDNQIRNLAASNSRLLNLPYTKFGSNGTIFRRNKYSAPNDATPFQNAGATNTSFATFKTAVKETGAIGANGWPTTITQWSDMDPNLF